MQINWLTQKKWLKIYSKWFIVQNTKQFSHLITIWPSLFLRTFFTHLGIELINFWQRFAMSSSWCQTEIMASTSLLTVVQSFDLSLFLMILRKFSMGFESGKFPGYSKTFISFSCNIFCTFLAEWQGAKSCLNMLPPSGNAICISLITLSIL